MCFPLCLLRAHAEFQLNEEPSYPFWFTPAQFAGRLIISKDAEHVEFFELAVPTDKALNIGKTWTSVMTEILVDKGTCSKYDLSQGLIVYTR